MSAAEERTQKAEAMAAKDKRQSVTRVEGSKKEVLAKKKEMLRGWYVDDAAHKLKMKAESLRIANTAAQPQMNSLQKMAQQQQAQVKQADAAYAASQERTG